jgi:predicted N-formylglutamate amidohydrolase
LANIAEFESAYESLLGLDEPAPFEVVNHEARSPFLVTCDHAGRRVPRSLGTLGLPESELERHIAWDIGAAGVARLLAAELGAFLILQTYSRLVIDCNRPLGARDSMTAISEDTVIPSNVDVRREDAERRVRSIFTPYHERIRLELERRAQADEPTVFLAVHSFTPAFRGVARPWHVGVLYNRDPRLARALLPLLGQDADLEVGDNEPYAVSDATDYGIVEYGERRGIPHVEIEIRQDLIGDEAGQLVWARRFAELIPKAVQSLELTTKLAGSFVTQARPISRVPPESEPR